MVFSSCLQLQAQEIIVEKCHAPRDPFDIQAMPEEFKIPDVPKTAGQVSCFASFKRESTMLDVVRKCGMPDQHTGSGIWIFVYYMNDCSTVTVGTPDLKRLGIRELRVAAASALAKGETRVPETANWTKSRRERSTRVDCGTPLRIPWLVLRER